MSVVLPGGLLRIGLRSRDLLQDRLTRRRFDNRLTEDAHSAGHRLRYMVGVVSPTRTARRVTKHQFSCLLLRDVFEHQHGSEHSARDAFNCLASGSQQHIDAGGLYQKAGSLYLLASKRTHLREIHHRQRETLRSARSEVLDPLAWGCANGDCVAEQFHGPPARVGHATVTREGNNSGVYDAQNRFEEAVLVSQSQARVCRASARGPMEQAANGRRT